MMHPLLIALVLLLACCSPSTPRSTDAGAAASSISPEELFGNDLEIIKGFTEIRACFIQERLNRTCEAYLALQRYLRSMVDPPKKRARLILTLTNLLSSSSSLSRRVAAENLFGLLQSPDTVKALRAALARERDPRAAAIMLRQLCLGAKMSPEALALPHLVQDAAPPVMIEAAACLGSAPKLSPGAVEALRAALRRASSPPRLKISLCAALGAARAAKATEELAAQLAVSGVGGPCSAALAAIGTEEAYRALAGALVSGSQISAQHIPALLTLRGRPFFESAALLPALARMVSAKELDWALRSRAVTGLQELGGYEALTAAAAQLGGRTKVEDVRVLEQIKRTLADRRAP